MKPHQQNPNSYFSWQKPTSPRHGHGTAVVEKIKKKTLLNIPDMNSEFLLQYDA